MKETNNKENQKKTWTSIVVIIPIWGKMVVEFYLYPTVGTVLIHSVKPELTE